MSRAKGYTHSPETRAKIGNAMADKWADPAYRALHLPRALALAAKHLGRVGCGRPVGSKHSPDGIEKIRRANIERWKDPEYRARHVARLQAMQPEAVKKAAAACSGRPRPERKQPDKVASAGRTKYWLGKQRSPETIEKIRQTMLLRWQDPEVRARYSQHGSLPAKGTPERKRYQKICAILGVEAARAQLKSAETDLAGQP